MLRGVIDWNPWRWRWCKDLSRAGFSIPGSIPTSLERVCSRGTSQSTCLPSVWSGCQRSAERRVHSLLLLPFQEAGWAKPTSISNRWAWRRAAAGIRRTTYGGRAHVESSAPGAPRSVPWAAGKYNYLNELPANPCALRCPLGSSGSTRGALGTEVPFLTWQWWKSTFLPTWDEQGHSSASLLPFLFCSILFLPVRLANEITAQACRK